MAIEFSCSQCGRQLRVPDDSAGKMARCPGCQAVLRIPGGGLPSELPKAGDLPKSSDPPRSTADHFGPPAESTGPTTSPPVTPVSAPSWLPSAGAFAPLPPPGAFTPNSPLPEQNPFADPNAFPPNKPVAGNPFAGAQGDVNPYSSPTGGYLPHQLPLDAGMGQGLPWELSQSIGTWYETLKLILFEMNIAFRKMKPEGGFLLPLMFFMACSSLGLAVNLLMNFGLELVQLNQMGWQGQDVVRMALGVAMIGCIGLVAAPIMCLFNAAVLHGCLWLVGGARLGYQTTFRVLAFAGGAMYVVSMIPCLGGCIVLVWGLGCITQALVETHRCTMGQAIGAVVLWIAIPVLLITGIIAMAVGVAVFAA